jgi:hypothetical protein
MPFKTATPTSRPTGATGQPAPASRQPAVESQPPPPADPRTLNITDDDIRQLAYRKWDEAGRPEGDGTVFWLQAERELKHAFMD